ncbi:hypothetical protein HDV63DRAFT_196107 [Trichoderma sp. SZMC 28014]
MATATPSRDRHHDVHPVTPSTEMRRLNGLFHRNEWWCNCDPRKRAVDRTVTRATRNKGKHFWACPHPPPDGCKFFLLAHEARVREIGLTPSSSNEAVDELPAVTTPSKQPTLTQTRLTDVGVEIHGGGRRRSDPEAVLPENDDDADAALHRNQTLGSSQPEAGSSSDKGKGKAAADRFFTYEPLTPGPSGGRKRGRDEFEEDLLSDMDSEEERELATMTDRSTQEFLRVGAYSGLQADDGEDDAAAGPSRPVARTLFPQAQGAKRRKSVSFEEPEPSAPTSSRATTVYENDAEPAPPPTGAMQMSPPSSMDETAPFPLSAMATTQQTDDGEDKEIGDNDITEQIMSLLQTQSIDPSVLASINNLLVVSARRTRGIAMGRDSARAAVNEKKMKIGRLQEKIAALENSERSLNGQITYMKAGLMKMYEAN